MEKPAIHFENVDKSFGDEDILRGFEMDVQAGELVAIVGPSGCGKSTLLRIIAGLETVDRGEFSIDLGSKSEDVAKDLRIDSGRAPIETGFVFQEANLLPWLTTFDNVALPFRITGQTVDRKRVEEVLRLVGLPDDSFDKHPAQLSGGMKMRVSIARALVLDPRCLLLDEPFAALDDLLRTSLNLKLMDIWMQSRQTMLFVTHNIAEAIFVCQKVLVMGRGTQKPRCLPIEFDYPRDKSIRSSTRFAELFAETSALLEDCSLSKASAGIGDVK